MKKKSIDYIDKKEMYDEIVKYKQACDDAENSDDDIPKISNKLGKMFIDISRSIASRPNFSGYSFKEEMINDGIENCLRAVRNFDPDKGSNPFGYFSQIIWFAFLRRIEKEKKVLYNKHQIAKHYVITGQDSHVNPGDQSGDTFLTLDSDYMTDFVEGYEETQRKKKAKLKEKEEANTGLDEFLE